MRNRLLALLLLLFVAVPSFAALTGTLMTGDGQPIAGAKVTLHSYEPIDSRRIRFLSGTPEPAPLATTQTDAKGNFTFESPKEPIVDVRVLANGYEPLGRRAERDEELGAIALRRAETKSGTVRAGGKPVANARLWWTYGGADLFVTTDAEGRYSVPDPKVASSVVVFHPNYALSDEGFLMNNNTAASARLERTLVAGTNYSGRVVAADGQAPVAKAEIVVDGWPLGTSADDGTFTITHLSPKWQMIVARAGSQVGMRSRTSDATTIRMAKGATLAGTVRDTKTQLPVPGTVVRISQLRSMNDAQNTVTDAKGNFSFTLAPGTYSVITSHPSYDTGMEQVSVAAGRGVLRTFSVAQLARISGTVVDEDRQPIAAAVVSSEEVRESGDMMMMGPRMSMRSAGAVRSGPDGRFTAKVAESEYKLSAAKKGLPAGKSDNVKVAAGDRKRGVVITVPRGFEVTGRVIDAQGNPLSGVSVSAAEAQGGGGGAMMQRIVMGGPQRVDDDSVVRTGSDGTFSMRLKEGTYDFTVRREGYGTKVVRAHQVAARTTPVETRMDPSVDISGRIVRNGVGIEGVNIFSFGMGTSSSATSGPDGSFTLADLSPGSIRVNFNKPDDFVQEMRNLNAPARDVVIELPSGGRVSGRVVDKATKQAVTNFQAGVSANRGGGGMVMMAPPQMRTFTSDDGSFVLENVPPGPVNVMVAAPGYTTARLGNLTLEEGKPISDVVVELDTGSTLRGKVTGPDGSPLGGATVRLSFNNPGRMAMAMAGTDYAATTEANGEYTIDAVEPGEKTFSYAHPDYLTQTKTVDVAGRETRVDVQLTTGQRINGTVVTDGGMPVVDAYVRAVSASGSASTTRSGPGGTFFFDKLQPGRYTFTAQKTGHAEGTLRDFDIQAGGQPRITLKSGATIYGRVTGVAETDYAVTMVEARGAEGSATASVDSGGNYRIEGTPTGTVRVSAAVTRGFPGRRTSQPKTVEVQPGDSKQLDVEFKSETVITGRVTRSGQPVTNASVSFMPRRGPAQTSASAPIDERGSYSVSGLEDGEYTVQVIDMQRLNPYNASYTVSGSGAFDIDIRGTSLRGRVLDAATGEPVTDARINLRTVQQEVFFAQRSAISDAGGAFTLDSVAPGRYHASAEKEGYGTQVVDVSVSDSSSGDVELKLTRNDGLTLRVVDARDGRALNASAYVTDMQGRVVQDDMFRMIGGGSASDLRLPLAAGQYRATISAFGYAAQTLILTAPGTRTVALTPGGTLVIRSQASEPRRARLLDASGQPYLRTGNRQPAFNVDIGSTTLQYVAPGTYTLQFLGPNDQGVVDSKTVTVIEGQTVTVEG